MPCDVDQTLLEQEVDKWVTGSVTLTRDELLALISPGGRCACGAPAVVRYMGGLGTWSFCWPRCMTCPGAARHNGQVLHAFFMEAHHRRLLKLLGDEAAFLAAIRLGWRPQVLTETNDAVPCPPHVFGSSAWGDV